MSFPHIVSTLLSGSFSDTSNSLRPTFIVLSFQHHEAICALLTLLFGLFFRINGFLVTSRGVSLRPPVWAIARILSCFFSFSHNRAPVRKILGILALPFRYFFFFTLRFKAQGFECALRTPLVCAFFPLPRSRTRLRPVSDRALAHFLRW